MNEVPPILYTLGVIDFCLFVVVIVLSIVTLIYVHAYSDCLRLRKISRVIQFDSTMIIFIMVAYLYLRFDNIEYKVTTMTAHMTYWLILDYCLALVLGVQSLIKIMIFRWICNRGNRCQGSLRIPFTVISEARLRRMQEYKRAAKRKANLEKEIKHKLVTTIQDEK